MRKPLFTLMASLLLTSFSSLSAQLTEVTGFGDNPGKLQLFHYLPDALDEGAPLVVVVHGCMETAANFARNTGWTELADEHGFALLFPQTSKTNEPKGGCYRTWEPAHQVRGNGEPASVNAMIDYMLENFELDPNQVSITGMSSGGHFTQVMLATYPERFHAGALQSSFPYKCANQLSDLGPCAFGQITPSAAEMAGWVSQAVPDYSGAYPKLQIWHGTEDPYIYALNQQRLVEQWGTVMALDLSKGVEAELLGYPTTRFMDDNGQLRLQSVTLTGMGHAIAVDPGDGPQQCGQTDTFAVDKDICAAYWIGAFFGVVDIQ